MTEVVKAAGHGWPAVIVHDAAEMAAVLRLAAEGGGAAGVLLLSVPGGVVWPGPAVFRAMVRAAVARCPGVPHEAVLDCADLSGAALGALRGGWRQLVLRRDSSGFASVQAAAAEVGARVWTVPPLALDLTLVDLRKPGGQGLVARWLSGTGFSRPDLLRGDGRDGLG
ncbi:hypothetical protein [Roseomonas elaeocarpi]|uniref:Uncharacterized protein n=1 Tax=Roseomonas elaeocarpi TaxID=907779 RepID=A0ABV6JQS1_9PROT